jgi:hypothetical protein
MNNLYNKIISLYLNWKIYLLNCLAFATAQRNIIPESQQKLQQGKRGNEIQITLTMMPLAATTINSRW